MKLKIAYALGYITHTHTTHARTQDIGMQLAGVKRFWIPKG